MNFRLSALKKGTRAALVALTLGAATLGAVPAQAAGPNFNFSLELGGGDFSFGARSGRSDRHYDRCLTDRMVVRGLTRYGFDDVRIVGHAGRNVVSVVAEWGRNDYRMKVNKCTGRVYDVQRIRHRPGYGFQFHFGS